MIRRIKYFFDEWPHLQKKLADSPIFLFLDFDGTLAPLAPTPDEAVLPQETKRYLEALSNLGNCRIAIVSGRGLRNVKEKVGLKNLIYVGNHGFEIEGDDLSFEGMFPPKIKSVLDRIKIELGQKLNSFDGVLIEDKGLTLSVHYRLVPEFQMTPFKKTLDRVLKPFLLRKEIKFGSGKKVYEINPPIEWDKGKAINWILSKERFNHPQKLFLPVFLGDDITDEDAFHAIRKTGITILVGTPRSSYARYYLRDSHDVGKFLKEILELKNKSV